MLRIYIVCKQGPDQLVEEIKSWLPDECDVLAFTNSLSALENIKSYKKPCIVFIQASRVAINGSDFLTMVQGCTPYTHVFVLCEGEQSHTAILNAMDLDEDEFICDNILCNSQHHEETEEINKKFISSVFSRLKIVSNVDSVLCDIKTKVDTLEKRTKLCVQKLQTIS